MGASKSVAGLLYNSRPERPEGKVLPLIITLVAFHLSRSRVPLTRSGQARQDLVKERERKAFLPPRKVLLQRMWVLGQAFGPDTLTSRSQWRRRKASKCQPVKTYSQASQQQLWTTSPQGRRRARETLYRCVIATYTGITPKDKQQRAAIASIAQYLIRPSPSA